MKWLAWGMNLVNGVTPENTQKIKRPLIYLAVFRKHYNVIGCAVDDVAQLF